MPRRTAGYLVVTIQIGRNESDEAGPSEYKKRGGTELDYPLLLKTNAA